MKRFLKLLVIGILLYPALLFGEEKLLTIIHTTEMGSLTFLKNIEESLVEL
jgi:hypothetical protein